MYDLRSDTVTKPTASMRTAMAQAEVGDDQFGEDPTVRHLEELAARMMGKEAALYVASGTMGNLVALLTHCGRGDEIIIGDESHIFWYESGGAAALGGMPFSLIPNERYGELDLNRIEMAIREPNRSGYPPTGVICTENTQNRCSGTILSMDYLFDLKLLADRHGVPIHMDGARIFNAAVGSDVPVEQIASTADSVQFCLSKGLAAPVGSIVAGDSEFIERAHSARKIVGGAMRQAGVIAAAGIVALEEMVDRLADDHQRALRLATGLNAIQGIEVDLSTVQSDIVIFQTDSLLPHPQFVAQMKDDGVLCSNYGTRGLRMVTHYQVDDDAIDAALYSASSIMETAATAA